MVKSNLVQPRLNPEVKIDEDNGETIRKWLPKTWRNVQQIQKYETEKSNIMNPKTKLTKGRLELLWKLDPFFLDYTITPDWRT